MLKFVYLVFAMAITPFVMEFINTRRSGPGNVSLWMKGTPAYLINVIICAVIALVICLLPGGWPLDFWTLVIVLFAVYFGNQAFFNLAIKPIVAYRKGT